MTINANKATSGLIDFLPSSTQDRKNLRAAVMNVVQLKKDRITIQDQMKNITTQINEARKSAKKDGGYDLKFFDALVARAFDATYQSDRDLAALEAKAEAFNEADILLKSEETEEA